MKTKLLTSATGATRSGHTVPAADTPQSASTCQKTSGSFHPALTRWTRLLLAFIVIASAAMPAMASHFRYGNLSWQPTANAGEVRFNFTGAFRRSSYGAPNVGDVFTESQGGTSLLFGDGGSTGTLQFRVIALSATDDYVIGEALNPGTSAAGVLHTYAGAGPFFNAGINTCCRVSSIINRTGQYALLTTVSPLAGNSSPISTLVPIVTVTQGPASTFTVPASDPNGDGLRFRFATNLEAGDSSANPPPGMTINPNSGTVTWNTVGLSTTGLYTQQVIVEDLDALGNVKTATPVDFLLKIDVSSGTPPTIAINPPGPFNVAPGTPIAFNVSGADIDAGATVTLNTGGLPSGATMAPVLPISGAGDPGVNSNFAWTPQPANSGSYVVTYSVTDNTGSQVQGAVQINVSTLPAPTVTGSPVTGITQTGATLNGIVNPNGVPTTYRFEYGLDVNYGGSTAPVSAGAGTADVPVSGAISGLALNTLYHYRLVSASAGGTSVTPDATFTTAGVANMPPTVSLTAPSNPTTITEITPLVLTATAGDADGVVTQVEFFEGTNSLGVDTLAPYEVNAGTLPVGTYLITAVATDNSGDSVTSSVATLEVVEATPIVRDDFAFTNAAGVTVNPVRNDRGPGTLALTLVSVGGSPTKGTARLVDGDTRIRYTATSPLGQNETDSFTYTVRNSLGREATGTVTLYPAPVKGSQFVAKLIDHHGEVFGHVTYLFTGTGTATGVLRYNGKRYSFKSYIAGDSPRLISIKTRTTPIVLEVSAGAPVNGSVTLASQVLDTFGDEYWSGDAVYSPYNTNNLSTRVGKYTIGFDPDAAYIGDNAYPQGGAGLVVSVTSKGAIRIVGRSPDGTSVTGSSYILSGETAPFFMATGPTARKGKWHGDLEFTASGPELAATSEWTMPALATSLMYPAGFTVNMTGEGGVFIAPGVPSGTLSGPTLSFVFAGGGFLVPITADVTLGSEVTVSGPSPLVTTVARKSGVISGRVANAQAGGSQSFFGVALQHPALNRVQGSTYRKTGIGSFDGVVVVP